MVTTDGIKKIPRMDVTSKIHLFLTWGTYGDHLAARSANEAERSLFDCMRNFCLPETISSYIPNLRRDLAGSRKFSDMLRPEPDALSTARAVSAAPAPAPVNAFIDQTLRRGFERFSNFLREDSPTWTQVKSAIVNVLYSNYVFAPLSDALDKNNLEASRSILLHAKGTDYGELYNYRLNMLKNNICDSLCRMKPHLSRSDLKHLDIVDFFLTWKSAFTGERNYLKRICSLQIEILSIDINLGVDVAMKKYFDLRTKLGDDWKATPVLPTSSPSWMQIYGFLFKDITLPSLHPVFQTFNEKFFKIKGASNVVS